MSLKEADRLAVLKQIESKKLSLGKGASKLGISYRQMKRVWKRYRQKGAKGLLFQRRGDPSPNRLSTSLQRQALTLIKENYGDYGPTLIAEKFKEKHSLELSKETLRQLMIKEGLWKA